MAGRGQKSGKRESGKAEIKNGHARTLFQQKTGARYAAPDGTQSFSWHNYKDAAPTVLKQGQTPLVKPPKGGTPNQNRIVVSR